MGKEFDAAPDASCGVGEPCLALEVEHAPPVEDYGASAPGEEDDQPPGGASLYSAMEPIWSARGVAG
eukprot:10113051-Lingulodinium_polyedra.AAC.1